MKVLIVRLSAFGDIIHALPAAQDVLAHPDVSEVHWLIDTRYAFMVPLLPTNIHVHMICTRGSSKQRNIVRTIRQLRNIHFDIILDLQGLIKSAVIARSIGRNVYGLDAQLCRERISSWLTTPVAHHRNERHVIQQYRRVAQGAMYPDKVLSEEIPLVSPVVTLKESAIQEAEKLIRQWKIDPSRLVVLHLGAGWKTKQLPENTWVSVSRALSNADVAPVLLWGNDSEFSQAMRIHSQAPQCTVPETRLDSEILSGVLSLAKAVVGSDTGVSHLAAALGTPTVIFWGPTASWRSGPVGEKHSRIETHPDCGPCFKRDCDEFICLPGIQSKTIVSAIQKNMEIH